MRKNIYIIPLLILFLTTNIKAQDRGMAFLKGTPQSNVVNPAFRLADNDKFYIALPALGSISASAVNTGFSWNDLFYERQDSLYVDLNNLDTKLQNKNYTNVNTSIQVLGFGIKSGRKSYFTFDLNAKSKISVAFPDDITNIRYGNWDYNNNTPINQNLSGISADGIAYTELAFGYNRKITDKLTAGIRLKYIMGAVATKSDQADLYMRTSTDGDVTIHNDISILTSGPIHATFDKDGNINGINLDEDISPSDFIGKNTGMGIDVGATYQLNDKIMIAAAINDLGFINWGYKPQRFYSKGTFAYSGADITDIITGKSSDDLDLWEDIGDSLSNSFNVENIEENSFGSDLMFNANLMGTYKFREWVDFGAIITLDHNWTSSLTLSASLNPTRVFSGVVTYSLNKNDFAELGAGFMVRGGCFQYYMMSDNINAAFFPKHAKYASLRFGINFIFGTKSRKIKCNI